MRKLLIVAALIPSAALATSGVPVGQFGGWMLMTDPPMLWPATHPGPPEPMSYSAMMYLEGIRFSIRFTRQVAHIHSHYNSCSAEEEISVATGQTRALTSKVNTILVRQFAYVSGCVGQIRDTAIPKAKISNGLGPMLQALEDWRIRSGDPA